MLITAVPGIANSPFARVATTVPSSNVSNPSTYA